MDFDDGEIKATHQSTIDELEGNLRSQAEEDKLLHSVMAGDKENVENAELVQEASNRNIGTFTPDLMYNNLVKNFHVAEQLYGPKLIRLLTGYNPESIEKNIKIPEFKKELQQAIQDKIQDLKDKELLSRTGNITDKGQEHASLILIKQLDNFITKDKIGEKTNKKHKHYGEKATTRPYKKGDRYKDIHLKKSIHHAIKKGHTSLQTEDLIVAEREGKGNVTVILAIDVSSSMKGKKIETCKKSSIALAHHAITEKDKVGIIAFNNTIKKSIPPTTDFTQIVKAITTIKTEQQTDYKPMLENAIELFPPGNYTKHLIILTDAAPTVGDKPEQETLHAVSKTRSAGITISIIGIQLEKEGIALAQQITRIGEGHFNLVHNLDEVGTIVLQDYEASRQ